MSDRGAPSKAESALPPEAPSPGADLRPRVRVRIWLETDQGLFVGLGRAQLLANIARYGSLKQAAEHLGMSYRAAWGKLRESEKVLGFQLVARKGRRRDGQVLTPFGRLLMERYLRWFEAVEKDAQDRAREIFGIPVRPYAQP